MTLVFNQAAWLRAVPPSSVDRFSTPGTQALSTQPPGDSRFFFHPNTEIFLPAERTARHVFSGVERMRGKRRVLAQAVRLLRFRVDAVKLDPDSHPIKQVGQRGRGVFDGVSWGTRINR